MYIKVSKTLCKFLNENLKTRQFKLIYQEVRPETFTSDYLYFNEYDYNPATGKVKTFIVSYDPELYACDDYIGTYELNKMFKRTDRTIEGFAEELKNEYCI